MWAPSPSVSFRYSESVKITVFRYTCAYFSWGLFWCSKRFFKGKEIQISFSRQGEVRHRRRFMVPNRHTFTHKQNLYMLRTVLRVALSFDEQPDCCVKDIFVCECVCISAPRRHNILHNPIKTLTRVADK